MHLRTTNGYVIAGEARNALNKGSCKKGKAAENENLIKLCVLNAECGGALFSRCFYMCNRHLPACHSVGVLLARRPSTSLLLLFFHSLQQVLGDTAGLCTARSLLFSGNTTTNTTFCFKSCRHLVSSFLCSTKHRPRSKKNCRTAPGTHTDFFLNDSPRQVNERRMRVRRRWFKAATEVTQ